MKSYSFQIIYSLREVKEVCRKYGYTVQKIDGELVGYPRGHKVDGPYSVRSTDDTGSSRFDFIKIIRAEAAAMFSRRVAEAFHTVPACLPMMFAIPALLRWHAEYGRGWAIELRSAWFNGNYNRPNNPNDESTLQSLRNGNGREVLSAIESINLPKPTKPTKPTNQ